LNCCIGTGERREAGIEDEDEDDEEEE